MYAAQFNIVTGEGFISKGELQSDLRMNNAELQDLITRTLATPHYHLNIAFQYVASYDVICSSPNGEIIQQNSGGGGFTLDHQLRTNNRGHLAGIELLGFSEKGYVDPVKQLLEGGPGSVCEYDDLLYILTEITKEQIAVEFVGQGLRAEIPTNAMHVYDIDETNAAIKDRMNYDENDDE